MAAKKSSSGKKPPASSASKKKPMTAAQKRGQKVSSAIASPARYAGSAKVKKKPYNPAAVERERAAYEKSMQKKIGTFLETFTPIGAFGPATRAITGRDWTAEGSWEKQQRKTKNRLGDAAIALLYSGTGQGKATKAVGKAVKKARQANASNKTVQEIRKYGANKRMGAKAVNKRDLS